MIWLAKEDIRRILFFMPLALVKAVIVMYKPVEYKILHVSLIFKLIIGCAIDELKTLSLTA